MSSNVAHALTLSFVCITRTGIVSVLPTLDVGRVRVYKASVENARGLRILTPN